MAASLIRLVRMSCSWLGWLVLNARPEPRSSVIRRRSSSGLRGRLLLPGRSSRAATAWDVSAASRHGPGRGGGGKMKVIGAVSALNIRYRSGPSCARIKQARHFWRGSNQSGLFPLGLNHGSPRRCRRLPAAATGAPGEARARRERTERSRYSAASSDQSIQLVSLSWQ